MHLLTLPLPLSPITHHCCLCHCPLKIIAIFAVITWGMGATTTATAAVIAWGRGGEREGREGRGRVERGEGGEREGRGKRE